MTVAECQKHLRHSRQHAEDGNLMKFSHVFVEKRRFQPRLRILKRTTRLRDLVVKLSG